jgi:dephospho-CoA kinase
VSIALRVGLTGGIGSGKSTVLQMLVAHGATAIDADAISRSLTATGGAALPAIAQRFGARFVGADGALDRTQMRQQAYADPQARKALEEILHPLIGAAIERQVQAAQHAGSSCLVFDVPLLVESGRWRQRLDQVVVVDCSIATQIERVVARSALQPREVEAIIAAQAPRKLRLAAADVVLFNEGITLAQLRQEVDRAAQRFGL